MVNYDKGKRLSIRVTPEEKEMIDNKVKEKNTTIKALVMNSIENNITINLDTSDYRDLVIQFRRIGNNINSLIRDIRYSKYFSDNDVLILQNNLKSLEKILEKEKTIIKKTKNSFEKLSSSQIKSMLEKEKKSVPMYLVFEEIENHIVLLLRSFVDLIVQEKLNETYPSYIDFFIKKFDSTNYDYEELVLFSNDLDKALFSINRKINTANASLTDKDFLNVMEVLNKYRKVSDK